MILSEYFGKGHHCMDRKLVTRWIIDIVYITLGAAIY